MDMGFRPHRVLREASAHYIVRPSVHRLHVAADIEETLAAIDAVPAVDVCYFAYDTVSRRNMNHFRADLFHQPYNLMTSYY